VALKTLDDGRAAWAQRKSSCDEYTYDREFFQIPGIVPGIDQGTTTVHIAGDRPIWRQYTGARLPDGGAAESWVEEGLDVGSHASGSPADTVEELTQECETFLKVAQTTEYIVVVTDGVPRACRFLEGSCAGPLCLKDQIDVLGFFCGAMSPTPVTGVSAADGGTDAPNDG
jgi:hypothetical protein